MNSIDDNQLKDSDLRSQVASIQSLEPKTEGLQDMNNSVDVESKICWLEDGQEIKGIIVDLNDDIALVEEVDEAGKRTGEFYEIEYVEAKLRTFVVMEKADEMMEKGAIVSWDTSKGKFYGDVAEVVTEGMARGEPQGLEIEGSKDNPAYVVRVWMQADMRDLPEDYDGSEDDEKAESAWHMTNTTVVARGDALKVEEALPTGTEEDDYDSEDEDEETSMKSMDMDLRTKVTELIKANAEILELLSASEQESDVIDEGKTAEIIADATTANVEEVKLDETLAPSSEDAVGEVKTEEVIEEVKTEEAVVEVLEEKVDIAVEEVVVEETPAVVLVGVSSESKGELTFDDLKEFHNLLKDISK